MAKERRSAAGAAAIAAASAATGLTAGWILYSAVGINHHLPLPPALEAERRAFVDRYGRLLTMYADARGGGRPVVLVHSINAAASTYEMRPLFELLRGSRPVYALDLPGFGFSDRSDRHYTPQLFGNAILDLLQEIGEPCDVVALSLGSEFAARAALEAPQAFASLALLSPTGMQADQKKEDGVGALRVLSFPLWSQALYDLLVTRGSIRYFLRKSFVDEPDAGLVEYAYLTAHQPGARYAPLAFLAGQLFTPQAFDTLYRPLQVPVMVVYDEDPFTSFERLPPLLGEDSNWQAARISPTRGMAHFERTADTIAALARFWSSTRV